MLLHVHEEEGKPVNTVTDVIDFSVMRYVDGQVETSEVQPGSDWPKFVQRWMGVLDQEEHGLVWPWRKNQ